LKSHPFHQSPPNPPAFPVTAVNLATESIHPTKRLRERTEDAPSREGSVNILPPGQTREEVFDPV
jgi:hypothetical protein